MRYISLNLLLFVLALLAKPRVLSFQLSNFGRSTIVLPATRQSEQEDSNISSQQPKTQFALLIDADNSPYYITQSILDTIAELGGDAIIRRVYGDFTLERCRPWRAVALNNSIIPVSVPTNDGRRSTDAALIIDAMEILFTKPSIGGFAIVSSDSDFTDLAQRLCEEGKQMIGFGQQQTPTPFVNACEKFIFTEDLTIVPETDDPPLASTLTRKIRLTTVVSRLPMFCPGHDTPTHTEEEDLGPKPVPQTWSSMLQLIHQAIRAQAGKDGWVDGGGLKMGLLSLKSDFDVRHYGYKKMKDMIEAFPGEFEIHPKRTAFRLRSRVVPIDQDPAFMFSNNNAVK